MLISMKNNIYFLCLFIGTFIACSSSSWFLCWLGLEINLMSLIPLLINKINPYSTETSIKYFIAQALASILIIFMSIFMFSSNSSNSISLVNPLILLALSIKMGAAPLHFWLPQVIQTSKWIQTLIILTWQKIAPMLLMIFVKNNFIKFMIIFSCLIGAMGAINQTLVKKILVYSSILHTGWMLSSLLCSENIWLMYFILYSSISASVILPMVVFNFKSSEETIFSQMNSLPSSILLLNFLSLAGIPPLLGFLMKLNVLILMISLKFDTILLILLIMSSLVSLFYYMRLMFSSMILTIKKNKFIAFINWSSPFTTIFLTFSFFMNLIFPVLFIFS